jgi:hypothetical protein
MVLGHALVLQEPDEPDEPVIAAAAFTQMASGRGRASPAMCCALLGQLNKMMNAAN